MTDQTVSIDLERVIGSIDRGIFGGFLEHLGRCIYGGVFEPDSPKADEHGVRTDVLEALRGLRLANIRYPGGNFVSGYRWRDGVGPAEDRPTRLDLAWRGVDTNRFGTDEFLAYCRRLGTEPYMVVNCGDGDLREARDWVEYCNGSAPTEPVRLRTRNGHADPYGVRLWGIGNEVDGPWQIGYKEPAEYARAYHEMAKVMRWVDPTIQLIASGTSSWDDSFVERAQLLVEQAGDFIDYMSIHWYVGDRDGDLAAYLATSELIEDRLAAYEGLMRALALQQHRPKGPIPLAVDEWNVWYRATPDASSPEFNGLEETYDLADALVVALHLNAFIRHCRTVRMANLAQLVNVIAPMVTTPDDLLLQTTYFPFELYSTTAGSTAIDACVSSDTFSGGEHPGVPYLDVSATLDGDTRAVSVFVVNRRLDSPSEVELRLAGGRFPADVEVRTITGPEPRATNSWQDRSRIATQLTNLETDRGPSLVHTLEPHSVTGFRFTI
jgi:alpha-L-arabinofuranosidase